MMVLVVWLYCYGFTLVVGLYYVIELKFAVGFLFVMTIAVLNLFCLNEYKKREEKKRGLFI